MHSRRFGRGLQNPTGGRAVALVPNASNPATTVYISEGKTLLKSTDSGNHFAFEPPARVFDAEVFTIVCPDANRVWIGLRDGTVHFSPDGGSSWQDFSPGGAGAVTGIAVDPGNINRVVIVCAGFSAINSRFRTKHCFLREDSGATWTDIGGTDGANNSNLPDLPYHSVVFDGSTAPPGIIVGCDAAVLRSGDNGFTWQRLGSGLPRATCRSLAIDNSPGAPTPRLLRLGTYGRSSFQLSNPAAASIAVEANLGFGAVRQNQTAILNLRVLNVSSVPLNITGFSLTSGDPDFDFVKPPLLGQLVAGEVRPYDIKFTPSVTGIRTAIFTLTTDLTPSVTIPASGEGFPSGKPRLAVNANLNFGGINRGATRVISFSVANTGLDNLSIFQMNFSGDSDFTIAVPKLPLKLPPGAQKSIDVTFAPSTFGGNATGTLSIASTDPRPDPVKVPVNGVAPYNYILLIVLIGLGAAVAVGGGIAIYEAIQSQKH